MQTKSNRGGPRPNSGVKPLDGATNVRNVTVSLDDDTVAAYKAYAEREFGKPDLSAGIRHAKRFLNK